MSRVINHDVFLSATEQDAGVAEVVRRSLEVRGLKVFSVLNDADRRGLTREDAIRSAMQDSRVFVAILTRFSVNSTSMALELGAALAWGKAIFLLLDGLSPAEIPSPMNRYRMIPIANYREIIDEVERSSEPLSPDQLKELMAIYASVGVSTDQLPSRPAELDSITGRFNKRFKTSYPPERVLQELIRLRKQGKLPRLLKRTGSNLS